MGANISSVSSVSSVSNLGNVTNISNLDRYAGFEPIIGGISDGEIDNGGDVDNESNESNELITETDLQVLPTESLTPDSSANKWQAMREELAPTYNAINSQSGLGNIRMFGTRLVTKMLGTTVCYKQKDANEEQAFMNQLNAMYHTRGPYFSTPALGADKFNMNWYEETGRHISANITADDLVRFSYGLLADSKSQAAMLVPAIAAKFEAMGSFNFRKLFNSDSIFRFVENPTANEYEAPVNNHVWFMHDPNIKFVKGSENKAHLAGPPVEFGDANTIANTPHIIYYNWFTQQSGLTDTGMLSLRWQIGVNEAGIPMFQVVFCFPGTKTFRDIIADLRANPVDLAKKRPKMFGANNSIIVHGGFANYALTAFDAFIVPYFKKMQEKKLITRQCATIGYSLGAAQATIVCRLIHQEVHNCYAESNCKATVDMNLVNLLPNPNRIANITFSSPAVGTADGGFYNWDLRACFRIFNNADPVVRGTRKVYSLFKIEECGYTLDVYNQTEFTEFLAKARTTMTDMAKFNRGDLNSKADVLKAVEACAYTPVHGLYYLPVMRYGRVYRLLHTM